MTDFDDFRTLEQLFSALMDADATAHTPATPFAATGDPNDYIIHLVKTGGGQAAVCNGLQRGPDAPQGPRAGQQIAYETASRACRSEPRRARHV
jgi:hypothetical protein